jgi:hypothetical protein
VPVGAGEELCWNKSGLLLFISSFRSFLAPPAVSPPRDNDGSASSRDGGATVTPLAGARVRPEPRAAPSSGTVVVP